MHNARYVNRLLVFIMIYAILYLEMRYFMKDIFRKILTFLFPWLFETESESNKHQTSVTYQKHDYLTMCEFDFYHKLIPIEKHGDYKVIPQVNIILILIFLIPILNCSFLLN